MSTYERTSKVQSEEEVQVSTAPGAETGQEASQGAGKGIFGTLKEKLGFREGGPEGETAEEEVRHAMEAAAPTTPSKEAPVSFQCLS